MNRGHDEQYKRNVALLGGVVRSKREAANIKPKDLAYVASVDPTTLSRFESGRATIGLESIERIISALEFMKALALKADLADEMGDHKLAEDMRVLRPLYAKRAKGPQNDASLDAKLGELKTIHPYAKHRIRLVKCN